MDSTSTRVSDRPPAEGDYPEPNGTYPKTKRAIQDGILALLEEGRETTGSLASNLDVSPNHIRDQMEDLRDEWGYVRYYHQNTALHEIVPPKDRNDTG